MRARAKFGASVLVGAFFLSGCTSSQVSKALQLGATSPLPSFSKAVMPGGFVGVVQRCASSGRPPCFDDLAFFSTENGAKQRTLATYPLEHEPTNAAQVGINYPSRGPTGDIWFILTEPLCRSELYRIDSRSGHIALVEKRCGFMMRSPVQSPNGRFLAYILESGDLSGSALVIRNLSDRREREILPVDPDGTTSGRPKSVLPVRITPSFNDGGGPGPNNDSGPARFPFGITWSLDSSRVGVGHVFGKDGKVCGPEVGPNNSCFIFPDRAFDVFDVASLKRLVEIHGPGHCQINTSAFDRDGLVIGQMCDFHDSDVSIVQYASDLRTVLAQTKLDNCAIEPFLVAGGQQHDVTLISTYDYCPKSPWPGKPPLKNIGPQQLIEVLQDGRLRLVHVYPSSGEQLREVGW